MMMMEEAGIIPVGRIEEDFRKELIYQLGLEKEISRPGEERRMLQEGITKEREQYKQR